MQYLNNLTKEQRYWFIAALVVGGYALFVRSKRKATAGAIAVQPQEGTGAVYGNEGGFDMGSLTDTINAALGQQSQGNSGIAALIERAVTGLSTQNAALATAIETAAEGNVEALQTFQQAETAALGTLKTDFLTALTTAFQGNNTKMDEIKTAVTQGFTSSGTANTSLFNAIKTFMEGFSGRVDAAFTSQNTLLQNSVNAVNSLAPKLNDLPGADMYFLLMGSQTTAACAVPGGTSDLACYNERHAFDGTSWLANNNNNAVGAAVNQKWGSFVRNGEYDLVAIGKQVWQRRGSAGSGGGGGGGQVP